MRDKQKRAAYDKRRREENPELFKRLYDEWRRANIDKVREIHKTWKKKNKGYFFERKRKNKARIVEYMGGKCSRCNGVFPNCVYQCHHPDPSIKDMDKGRAFSHYAFETIKDELDKCVLLCANCHFIVHDEMDFYSVTEILNAGKPPGTDE